jgi:multimeric flavodoxin WrbA
MKITCISASNVERARQNSASTHACQIVAELVAERNLPGVEVEIIPLLDYDLVPCRMCGQCLKVERCANDEAFTRIYARLIESDAIFVVAPHYATLPAKLVIILEKLQEMTYLRWCADNDYRFTLDRRPVGLIAHGGQTEEALPYYKTALLDPLAMALASVQMNVVGAGEAWPNGVTFGIKSLAQPPDSVFVDIEHDWSAIRQRITPLVDHVLAAIA